MEWVTPQFTRGQVDAAGRVLVDPTYEFNDFENTLEIVSN